MDEGTARSDHGRRRGAMQAVRQGWRESSTGVRVLLGVLSTVALAALVILWRTWSRDLEAELAKTALSVLAVSVVGTAVTLAVEQYRRQRDKAEREHEGRMKQDQDERLAWQEDVRRDTERAIDDRHRRDDQLRILLTETIRTYNEVKEVRRHIKAQTGRDGPRAITLKVYDASMNTLIPLQLRFEEFKRTTGVNPGLLGVAGTTERFRGIEKYLNKVIDEYLDSRHRLSPEGTDYPLARLPRLDAFLHSSVRDDHCRQIGFNPHVADQMDAIIREVQGALLDPIRLSSVSAKPEWRRLNGEPQSPGD